MAYRVSLGVGLAINEIATESSVLAHDFFAFASTLAKVSGGSLLLSSADVQYGRSSFCVRCAEGIFKVARCMWLVGEVKKTN